MSIVAKRIRIPLDTKVDLSLGDIVLDRDPVPPPLKGHSPPQFSAHVCCGQTAGLTKMPLGMEVGLSLGDCVRWEPSSPLRKKGTPPPNFRPMLLWPNGCMDVEATWYGSTPQPRPHCTKIGSQLLRKGRSSPPYAIVAK